MRLPANFSPGDLRRAVAMPPELAAAIADRAFRFGAVVARHEFGAAYLDHLLGQLQPLVEVSRFPRVAGETVGARMPPAECRARAPR